MSGSNSPRPLQSKLLVQVLVVVALVNLGSSFPCHGKPESYLMRSEAGPKQGKDKRASNANAKEIKIVVGYYIQGKLSL